MIHNLSSAQLISLLQTVFAPGRSERGLSILVDVPRNATTDSPAWKDRRRIAAEWYMLLRAHMLGLPFTSLAYCTYPDVGTNNGDLPTNLVLVDGCSADLLTQESRVVGLEELLSASSVILSITQYSATAPLKILARRLGFRGATLPGFRRDMMPALGLDFEAVNARVLLIKRRLDDAVSAQVRFAAGEKEYTLDLDLRFTTAHASSGLVREPGTVGNLPSGEAYIVPFEGRQEGPESATRGVLPVQFGDEIVLFEVEQNRARRVLHSGPASVREQEKLVKEPAYGNIAELGVGVLDAWGVRASGVALLDEKLGLHIAFGRSDHFGGRVGPSSFRDAANMVHIDWVYVPSVQSSILAKSLTLSYPGGAQETILADGRLIV